jgi:drug/metabolite transporter (DMT)-like permease
MGFRGAIAYSSLALFWAALFVSLTASVATYGVGLTIAVFGFVGAVALTGLAIAVGRKLVWRLPWGEVLGWAGLALLIVVSCCYAMAQLGAGLTAVMVSTIPMAASVVAQARGKERVTGLGALSLSLGVVGLLLVLSFSVVTPSLAFISGAEAALIAVGTAGVCSGAVLARAQSAHALETAIIAALFIGVGGLVMAPFTSGMSTRHSWALAVVAAAAAICAFLVLFALSSASDSVPRRTAATLPGVGTVLAVVASMLILQEHISVLQVVGMLLILAGTGLLRGLVPQWFPASWRA